MDLIAITLARVVSFMDVQALDPFGKTLDIEAFKELGRRYSFAKVPENFAELDMQKGINFISGACDGIKVDKLTLYQNGLVVDTRSSTNDCQAVVDNIIDFAHEMFGAKVKVGRRLFVSQLVFQSDVKMAFLNPVIQRIIDRITESVSKEMNYSYSFDASLLINAELWQAKVTPGVFSIERRADTPFAENMYFSSAPLRTEDHLNVLREFESELLK
jgi:hypothetical protein